MSNFVLEQLSKSLAANGRLTRREAMALNDELRRDVSEDAIAADVRLFEVDFHFQVNKTGTIGDIPVT